MGELIERLEIVKQHLMAHDGWSRGDIKAIDKAIEILEEISE